MTKQVMGIVLYPEKPGVLGIRTPDEEVELIFAYAQVVANQQPVSLAQLLTWFQNEWATDLTDPSCPVFVTLRQGNNTIAEFVR